MAAVNWVSGQCFPGRRLGGRQQNNQGEWIKVHEEEQRRRFEAVLAPDLVSGSGSELGSYAARARHPPNSPYLSHDSAGVLNGYLLMAHCNVADPVDLCTADVSGLGLHEVIRKDMKLFTNIVCIKAGDNSLAFESFNTFPSLVDLSLQANAITSVQVDGKSFSQLMALDLSFNSLSQSSIVLLGRLPSLIKLDLSGNDLRLLPLEMTHPLNRAKRKRGEFYPYSALEELRLSDNQLSDPIAFGILASMSNLRRLYVDGNFFKSVPQLQAYVPVDALGVGTSNFYQMTTDDHGSVLFADAAKPPVISPTATPIAAHTRNRQHEISQSHDEIDRLTPTAADASPGVPSPDPPGGSNQSLTSLARSHGSSRADGHSQSEQRAGSPGRHNPTLADTGIDAPVITVVDAATDATMDTDGGAEGNAAINEAGDVVMDTIQRPFSYESARDVKVPPLIREPDDTYATLPGISPSPLLSEDDEPAAETSSEEPPAANSAHQVVDDGSVSNVKQSGSSRSVQGDDDAPTTINKQEQSGNEDSTAEAVREEQTVDLAAQLYDNAVPQSPPTGSAPVSADAGEHDSERGDGGIRPEAERPNADGEHSKSPVAVDSAESNTEVVVDATTETAGTPSLTGDLTPSLSEAQSSAHTAREGADGDLETSALSPSSGNIEKAPATPADDTAAPNGADDNENETEDGDGTEAAIDVLTLPLPQDYVGESGQYMQGGAVEEKQDIVANADANAMGSVLPVNDAYPPFQSLVYIDISNNQIEEEHYLLTLGTWPDLSHVKAAGNPFIARSRENKGLLFEELLLGRGIYIQRSEDDTESLLTNRQQAIKTSVGRFIQVDTRDRIPAIPRRPVEERIASERALYIQPSPMMMPLEETESPSISPTPSPQSLPSRPQTYPLNAKNQVPVKRSESPELPTAFQRKRTGTGKDNLPHRPHTIVPGESMYLDKQEDFILQDIKTTAEASLDDIDCDASVSRVHERFPEGHYGQQNSFKDQSSVFLTQVAEDDGLGMFSAGYVSSGRTDDSRDSLGLSMHADTPAPGKWALIPWDTDSQIKKREKPSEPLECQTMKKQPRTRANRWKPSAKTVVPPKRKPQSIDAESYALISSVEEDPFFTVPQQPGECTKLLKSLLDHSMPADMMIHTEKLSKPKRVNKTGLAEKRPVHPPPGRAMDSILDTLRQQPTLTEIKLMGAPKGKTAPEMSKQGQRLLKRIEKKFEYVRQEAQRTVRGMAREPEPAQDVMSGASSSSASLSRHSSPQPQGSASSHHRHPPLMHQSSQDKQRHVKLPPLTPERNLVSKSRSNSNI